MKRINRTPGEEILEDDQMRWETSKEECLFDEKSIIKESLNNIGYKDNTNVEIKLMKNVETDSEILEISDDGRGFKDETDFDNAMKLSATKRDGNNNYGIGLKSFMMINGKGGVFIAIAGNLGLIDIYGFLKKGKPVSLKLSDDEIEELKNYANDKTVLIAIYGSSGLFDRGSSKLFPNTINDLISKNGYEYYEPNDTNCEFNEDDENKDSLKSLSEYLSIDYYEKIKKGNKIILNGNPIKELDIYGIDRVQSIEIESGPFIYKLYTEVNIYETVKDGKKKYRRTLSIKNSEGNILYNQVSTEKNCKWGKQNVQNDNMFKKLQKKKSESCIQINLYTTKEEY